MINIKSDLEFLGVEWPIDQEKLTEVYENLLQDNSDEEVKESITQSYVRVLSQIKVANKYNALKQEQNSFMAAFFGRKKGPWAGK